MDKARALIDSVIRKGPRASKVCIIHIHENDSHLAEKMGLSSRKVTTWTNVHAGPVCWHPRNISSLVMLVCRQLLYVELKGPISKLVALLYMSCLLTLYSYSFSLRVLLRIKTHFPSLVCGSSVVEVHENSLINFILHSLVLLARHFTYLFIYLVS